MPVPDILAPVPQGMMLMSLCCMELQLDQWLLTKGRSASGSCAVSCGRSLLDSEQSAGLGVGSRVVEVRLESASLQWAHVLGGLVRPGRIQVSAKEC